MVPKKRIRANKVSWLGKLLAMLPVSCALLYPLYLAAQLDTVEDTYESPLLPQAFDGWRVAYVSDIHYGALLREDRVRALAERIAAQGGPAGRRAAHPPARLIIPFSPLLVDRRRSTGGRGRREKWIMDAVDIIRREACDGLSAADIAARFRCSRRLFDLRFKEALGHTAQDEIEHVRLEKAFELLRNGVPIGTIATLCGYRSDTTMRWVFLHRVGMSMRTWRTRNR